MQNSIFARLCRAWFLAACASLAAAVPLAGATAADVPQTINLIVGYPPGGSVDIVARLLAQPLAKELGANVVVENRAGAGGRIAAAYAKSARADGSYLMIVPNAVTTLATLVYEGKLNYDMRRDFAPVARLVSYPFALSVAANAGIKTPADLAQWLKQHPGQANYGSPGAGGMAHFSGLLYARNAGISWTHVPFAGGAPLVTNLLGGHVIAGVDTLVDHYEQSRTGKLHIIGIFSPQRYPLTPDIPTLQEQGVPGLDVSGWFAAYAPVHTPPELVARYDEAFRKVLASPDVAKRLNDLVLRTAYLSRDDLRKTLDDELAMWSPIIKESGFTPE
ncbi:Bug family tripartite tricarboxylate transporter substrate binding protein [Bordetella genomosp. 13]|uniref:Bug family tripartite tricarboxylate transporter substrate binding protein n=1 Tax=Bordetella genomosp. 13 TaxID=463040 RepID=UPI0016434412|nr:tripartite tricarboxylate transporter substrate-binding protein [Bordetella genomosp. 13]